MPERPPRNRLRLSRIAALALACGATGFASACGGEPAVSDNASFQRWRAWCSCKGGSPPATFNEAQRVGCRTSSASSSGLPSAQTSGQALGQALGLLVLEAFKEDPQAEARRREAAARAEEERLAHERMEKERAERLLGQMLDVSAPAPQGGTAREGGLGLMLGDEVPRRAESGGGASASAPVVGGLPLMTDDPPPAGSPEDKVKRSDAFNLGFNDARDCYSQSAGARCSAVAADRWQTCLDDYRGGYSAGEKARKVKMDEARRIGFADAAAGKPANAVGRTEAEGTCKVEWTESYNRGWFEGRRH